MSCRRDRISLESPPRPPRPPSHHNPTPTHCLTSSQLTPTCTLTPTRPHAPCAPSPQRLGLSPWRGPCACRRVRAVEHVGHHDWPLLVPAARRPHRQPVCRTGVEPRTSRPHTGLLLICCSHVWASPWTPNPNPRLGQVIRAKGADAHPRGDRQGARRRQRAQAGRLCPNPETPNPDPDY